MNQAEFYKKTLDFVTTTAKALKVASDLATKSASAEKAVNEKLASVVQVLKDAKLIDGHQTKQAESQLRNPAQALEILTNVVSHYREEVKQAQAKVVSTATGASEGPATKSASTEMKKNANYVGKRRGYSDAPSEADEALMRLVPGRIR